MKYLFLGILVVLIALSIGTALSMPDARSDVPVIYWVTDANPARHEQVKLFHQWMIDQGYYKEQTLSNLDEARSFVRRNTSKAIRQTIAQTHPRGADLLEGRLSESDFPLTIRLPKAELRLDMANSDRTKKIIQGVSGVAGDVMDQASGGEMRYFRAIGLNTDVTEAALKLGFDPSKTYPSILTEITLPDEQGNRRQYQFPCNVFAPMYYVNRQTFRQYNQPLPPQRWTIEEFERRGKEFVKAANAGRPRQTVFFADNIQFEQIRASLGGSRFNETATRAAVNHPATIEALRLMHKWMYVDRLIPTQADRQSFTVESGYGGANPQLFANNTQPERGQVAMLWGGRHHLIIFRELDRLRRAAGREPLDYGVAEAPHGGFPNTGVGTRAAMVYAGGRNKDLAVYFLAFLASREYNMQIVADGDSLPPNPEFTRIEEYLRPADYPNEWGIHEAFARAATELAVGTSYSPFILHATADRIEWNNRDKFLQPTPMASHPTPERTAELIEAELNAEMDRTIRENPALRPLYERLLARQAIIDELREQLQQAERLGQPITESMKIPVDLIENPFHRAYYAHKGWLKEGPN